MRLQASAACHSNTTSYTKVMCTCSIAHGMLRFTQAGRGFESYRINWKHMYVFILKSSLSSQSNIPLLGSRTGNKTGTSSFWSIIVILIKAARTFCGTEPPRTPPTYDVRRLPATIFVRPSPPTVNVRRHLPTPPTPTQC